MELSNILGLLADFNGWCSQEGVQGTFHLIKEILSVIRLVVPVALVVMTTLDITKKVINPEDKDGQKKIMYRAIGALVVFLTPTIVSIVFKVIDLGAGTSGSYNEANSGLAACWRNS